MYASPFYELAEKWRVKYCPEKEWPKITVVTPSLNQAVFLEKCILSIVEQRYPNLEYFVMDGGSTDHSVNIIKRYEQYITYWRSFKDKGHFDAVMSGFEMGSGDIMCWIASDDIHQGPSLFKIAALFMSYPNLEWLVGLPTVVDSQDQITFVQTEPLLSYSDLLNIGNMLEGKFIGAEGVFWKRSLWEKAGAYLTDEDANDYDLWVRFARHSKLCFVPDIFSSFRVHNLSNSFHNKKSYLKDSLRIAKREILRLEGESSKFSRERYPILDTVYEEFLPLHSYVYKLDIKDKIKKVPTKIGLSFDQLRSSLNNWESKIESLSDTVESYFKDIRSTVHMILPDLEKIDLVTFDCFDTLLYRFSDKPYRLFYEVARVLRKAGFLPEHIDDMEFCSLRQKAEELAREEAFRKRRSHECFLIEIYQKLQELIPNFKEAAEIELEVEKDLCFLNPSISDLARLLMNKGKRVGIISDTYFSSEQLKFILKYNAFPVELLDFVVTSCEATVDKASGLLFRYVQRKFGADPLKWVHIGDSEEADIKGAEIVGIRPIHYPKYSPNQYHIIWREELIGEISGKCTSLNSFRGIAGNNNSLVPDQYKEYFEIGAFLLGPIVARFVDWCVDMCVSENIEVALFFMREAHTLQPLFKMATKDRGVYIESHPFYISRYSVWLADIYNLTPEVLFSKIDHKRPTIRNILSSLKLSTNGKLLHLNIPLDEILDESTRRLFSEILVQDEEFRTLISKKIKEQRYSLINYFKQAIGNKNKIAFVDVGFRGMIQGVLDTLIRNEGIPCKTVGLYLATSPGAASRVLGGSDIRSMWGKLGGNLGEILSLTMHPEIMEIALNSTCGTTLGYGYNEDRKTWEPILEEVEIRNDLALKSYYMKIGIIEFYKTWLSFYRSKLSKSQFVDKKWFDEINDQCKTILKRLWAYPTKKEGEILGILYHEDNYGTSTGNFLCDAEARRAYREKGIRGLLGKIVYWPNGVIALETPEVFDQYFITKYILQTI